MEAFVKFVSVVLAVTITSAIFSLFLAFPIMWCWNYAVVAIWGLPLVTWGQAWCLSFLSASLIKSTLVSNS
jgi:hypothetical protein